MSNSETIKYCIYEFSSNQNTRLGFPSADSVKYKNCDAPHWGNCKENESIQGLEECISIAYMLFLFLHAMAFKFKGCKQEVACHLIWDKFILLKQNFHCFWDTVSSHAFPSLRGIFAFARSQNRKTKMRRLDHIQYIRRDYLHNTGVTELSDWNCQPLITRRTFSRMATGSQASCVN